MDTVPGTIFTTLNFIFNYKWFQKAKVFVTGKPFHSSVMQHSYLLGPFVSYEESEVLWIQSQGPYSQHLILFVTNEWFQKDRVFVTGKPFHPSTM